MEIRLGPEDETYLRERIHFCRTELADLQEYRSLTWHVYQADRRTRRDVERIIENVCNAVIDMSKNLLAAVAAPPGATYREVLLMLPLTGLVSTAEAEGLAGLAPLRNALSHRYLDYKWDAIQKFIRQDSDSVSLFLDRVEALLAANRRASGSPASSSGDPPPTL